MTFAQISVGLGDDSYGLLLRDYLHDRLGLKRDVAADEALVSQIIAAAEGRFVYVSFLADRFIALGRDRVEPELAAATEGGRSGEALYGLWLAQLDRNFGRKEADRIRQVLCVLAAAELAHGWVFGEGARSDPVDGTPLTMLSEEFAGLPLEVLATVLDSDVIDRIETDLDGNVAIGKDGNPIRKRLFDPVLLFTLERIQGVLRTSRGDAGGRRFRIGLKGLAEVMLHDDKLKAGIARAQAHLASHALDLVDTLLTEDAPTRPEPLDRELIIGLLPYSEAAVQLSGSELLAVRFDPDRVSEVLAQEHQLCAGEGRVSLHIGLCSVMAALDWQPCGKPLPDLSPEVQNAVTASLQNRGNAKLKGGALADAIADYDAAIAIRQDLRKALEPAGEWSIPLRNDLARSLQNRGLAKADSGALGEAVADHDAAIAIMQGLSKVQETAGQWSIPLRNDLAAMLQNRGLAKVDCGALGEAISDYDTAIAIMQSLRETLEPVGQWLVPLRNDLARSLQNRGVAKKERGALSDAIADYDAAIAIRQDLREVLEPAGQWSIPLRNDLANSLQSLGNAKADSGALGEAVADYDTAIAIKQDLREVLEPAGQWSIPLRNDLARSLQNRGNTNLHVGALAEAVVDYDKAITIMESLREVLEPTGDWSIPLRNDLAKSLQNRGSAKLQGKALIEAVADYDKAIAIMEVLRDELEPKGDWSMPLRNDLASVFQNRGVAKANSSALNEAIVDYDKAIAIMEGLRDELEPTGDWSVPLRDDLAGSFLNRGSAKRQDGALDDAVADYDEAIYIQQRLRELLEPHGQWLIPMRNALAKSLQNRANAKVDGGAFSEAMADYDAAISIMENLRAALERTGEWLFPMRNNHVAMLNNRANAKIEWGELGEAIMDYDKAIAIMECLREVLEQTGDWPIPLRNELAGSLVNRHIVLEKVGRTDEAKADLAGAIAILSDAMMLAGANAPPAWHEDLNQWKQWLMEM